MAKKVPSTLNRAMGLSCTITCLPCPGGISWMLATFTKRAIPHLLEGSQDGVGFEDFQVMKTCRSEPATHFTIRVTLTSGTMQQQVDRKERPKQRAGSVLVHEDIAQDQFPSWFQGTIDFSQDLLICLRTVPVQDIGEERHIDTTRERIRAEVIGDQTDPVCKASFSNQLVRKSKRPR